MMQTNKPILVWVALMAIGMAVSFHRGRIESELSSVLPKPSSPKQRLLMDELREGAFSRLMLFGLEGDELDVIAEASKFLSNALRATGDFVFVANGEQVWTEVERNLLFDHRYLLSPVDPSQFTAPALKEALAKRLRELASPLSPLFREQIPLDPTGEFRKVLRTWMAQDGPRTHHGVWLSKDGQRALVTAETTAPGFDLEKQQEVQNRIKHTFHILKTGNPKFGSVHLMMTGPAIFAVEARKAVQQETWWLSTAATLLVASFLYLNYRSVRPIVLILVPLLSGMVAAISIVILAVGFIHGITLAFGVTLMGVAVDYPIHLLSHLIPGASPKTVLEKIWPTMRLGVMTTVFGYSALLLSGFPGLFELGLFAVVGLTTAAVVTRWVLPHLIPGHFRPVRSYPWLNWMVDRLRNRAPWVLITVVAAIAVLAGSRESLWERDIANLIPVPEEKKHIDRTLRQEFSAPEGRTLVVVEGPSQEDVLRRIERLTPMLGDLVKKNAITGFDAATRYLPSRHTQVDRQRDLPERVRLNRELRVALRGLPFKAGAFEPFLNAVATTKRLRPLVVEDFEKTALGLKLRLLIFHRYGQWIGVLPIHSVTDAQALEQALAATDVPGVFYLNLRQESNRIVSDYGFEAIKISGGAVFGICLLLFWKLGGLWFWPRIVLPVGAAVIAVSAVLHSLGEQLSVFHFASMLLIVGIGLDYSLFFNRTHESVLERDRTTHAIATCAATTVLVFAVLAVSQIPVLRSIGLTVTLGALTSFVFSCILARGRDVSSGLVGPHT